LAVSTAWLPGAPLPRLLGRPHAFALLGQGIALLLCTRAGGCRRGRLYCTGRPRPVFARARRDG